LPFFFLSYLKLLCFSDNAFGQQLSGSFFWPLSGSQKKSCYAYLHLLTTNPLGQQTGLL